MSKFVDIAAILSLAIEAEHSASASYEELAKKVDEIKPELFNKPQMNNISWGSDVSFYKDLEEKVLGTESASSFYKNLPPKITNDDGVYFYKSLVDRFTGDVKGMFLSMSKDELNHAEIFKKILSDVEIGDENKAFSNDILDFLEKHSNDMKIKVDIAAPSSVLNVLDEAVLAEQRAVKFYGGMIPYANKGAIEILERIINEEKGHEARLRTQIGNYKLLIDVSTGVAY
ncbi:MAG: ferritin family protein [Defluviitaleaceae bacterium]|nr:ferritin family protein [Defluviitaleaceae bacterium]